MPSKVVTFPASQPMTIRDYIQADQYAPKIDPSVNKIPSKLFRASSSGDPNRSMVVTNYTEQNGGGGLVSKSYPLTILPNGAEMFFGMDLQVIYTAADWATIMRMEFDDKVMVADGTKQLDSKGNPTLAAQMNESHEWNPNTKSWQYDPDGNGWQNIGFNPKTPMLLTDPSSGTALVNDIRFRWWWNGRVGDGGRWSSLAMSQNGEIFTAFPKQFVNIPLIRAKWAGPLRHPQFQTEYTGPVPGSHSFEIVRGRLIESPSNIDINLPWAN